MVQYLLAADRDNPWVAHLYDPYHPAVLRALQQVAEASLLAGKPCSVCGEMAGDYATALILLGMGYTGVSMAPNFVGEVKYALRQVTLADAREMARQALRAGSGTEVRTLLEEARRRLHDSLTGEETSQS
jgi:phosphotransferase system enzyme I (PtsP)